jgi:FMN phosphatase YigB (HAD superfamily)
MAAAGSWWGSRRVWSRTILWWAFLPLLRLANGGFVSTKRLFEQGRSKLLSDPALSARATLGFLSFDLDDTLFSTTATVNDANRKQISYMNDLCADAGLDKEAIFTIESFQECTRSIRRELTEPVSYTTLRKLAIRRAIDQHAQVEGTCDLETMVNDIFNVWLQERHMAAERYLFNDTISTLDSIRVHYPDLCNVAITNGRGNPLHMPNTLAPYFDFCVSGEDANVFPHRKPSPVIYETARQRYQEHCPHHDTDRVWCHVGDCLANDVGASAACGALAVWYNSDATAYKYTESTLDVLTKSEPSWSTATATEVEQRQRLFRDAKSRIATRISKLSELEDALDELLLGAGRGQGIPTIVNQ